MVNYDFYNPHPWTPDSCTQLITATNTSTLNLVIVSSSSQITVTSGQNNVNIRVVKRINLHVGDVTSHLHYKVPPSS